MRQDVSEAHGAKYVASGPSSACARVAAGDSEVFLFTDEVDFPIDSNVNGSYKAVLS
jgi:hypothetical protein